MDRKFGRVSEGDGTSLVPAVSVRVEMKTLEEVHAYATTLAGSDLVPKDYRGKADNVVVAIMFGQEIGLSPLQALQNIANINGRPCVWGDAALGLVRSSGLLQDFDEWLEVNGVRQVGYSDVKEADGKKLKVVAYCKSMRKGEAVPKVTSFSVNDAKVARLWGKEGPWQTYPGRQLQMRARGFNLRDKFTDVLKGLAIYEEVSDITMEATSDGTYVPKDEPEKVEGGGSRVSRFRMPTPADVHARHPVVEEASPTDPTPSGPEVSCAAPPVDQDIPESHRLDPAEYQDWLTGQAHDYVEQLIPQEGGIFRLGHIREKFHLTGEVYTIPQEHEQLELYVEELGLVLDEYRT